MQHAGVARSSVATGRGAGFLWGSLGVLIFSVSLPATRLAVAGGLDPAFVGVGRAVVAGLMSAVVLLATRTPLPGRVVLLRLGVVALGVVVGFPLLTAFALARVPAVHGIVVTGLLPAATAVAAVVRAGERPSLPFWVAAAAGLICVLGFAVVEGGGRVEPADGFLLVAVVLCALGYAEGGALARTLGGVTVICQALVLALPVTVAITLASLDVSRLLAARPEAWLGFGYVCVFSMFLGFFAWYRGLALGGVARVGQVQLAQPLLSLGWAALLLGEPITLATLMVSCGVIACVTATQRAR